METMTFRSIKSVMPVALVAVVRPHWLPPTTQRSCGIAPWPVAATVTLAPSCPNHTGRIPVLEYHVIGGDKDALYTRTVASFKADLEDVYKRGYRPITIAQMLDKNFEDVPAGMSPVVFVFDDASPEQFSYIEGADGKLTIDPNSGIGIWLDFAKTHPGWKNRGTFCLLNGASAGHNFSATARSITARKKRGDSRR
jgi:hypothetical protein